jgi:hypothetical protein
MDWVGISLMEIQLPTPSTLIRTFCCYQRSFIDAAVNNDWNLFGEKLKGIGGKIFVFVGAWVIGLAIALLIFPFLLCCCICPWACPACGRNRERMPYTKC